jgi:hypothetical protein
MAVGTAWHIYQARKADIKVFDDAVRKIEEICGRKLSPAERRRLHDEITGGVNSYWSIVRDGVAMFCPEQGAQ